MKKCIFAILSTILSISIFAQDIPPALSLKNSILVIRASFLSNFGNLIYPSCNEACLTDLIWGPKSVQSYLSQQSGNKMAFQKETSNVVTVQINEYASSLGCLTDSWMKKAKEQLEVRGIKTDDYNFYLMLIPTQAGGGSCARFSSRSWFDKTKGKYNSVVRIPRLPWMIAGIGQSMDLYSIANGLNQGGDWSDPTGWPWDFTNQNYPSEAPGFNAPHIARLGWFPYPNTQVILTDTKSPTINMQMTSISEALLGPSMPANIKFDNYWVSLRTKSLNDTALKDDWYDRLYIYTQDSLKPGTSRLVTAPIKAGQLFIDENSNAIEFKSFDGKIAEVQFRRCQKNSASLQIEAKDEKTFNINVINNDINCPIPRYRIDAQCSGVACAFNSTSANEPLDVWVHLVPDLNPREISYQLSFDDKTILSWDGFNSAPIEWLRATIDQADIGRPLKFSIKDAGGDGICCAYGGGSYYEVGLGNALIRKGGEFKFQEDTIFNALPTTMLTVNPKATLTLTHDLLSPSTPVTVTLTELGPLGLSNGRPVVTATFNSSN